MFGSLWNALRSHSGKFWRDEEGAGAVEMIMIIAVVIIVAIIFREYLINFVKSLMGKAETESEKMFNYDYKGHFSN
jgi:Flp pilus assembly pilin Flp